MQEKQVKEAITCYRRALALDPDNAKLHYQLGQAYSKSGEKAAAQKEFAETRKLQNGSLERQARRLFGQTSFIHCFRTLIQICLIYTLAFRRGAAMRGMRIQVRPAPQNSTTPAK